MTSATTRPTGITVMAVVAGITGVVDILSGLGDIGIAGGFLSDHGFGDTLDGIMARRIGRSGKWGAYLDSTLDRVGDAAIFGGLVLFYADEPGKAYMAALALACLILGSVVSYAKARAEGLGMTANVGIAERADRLVVVLVATGLVGWFLPEVVLAVVLGLLALASLVTVVQRMLEVRRQALDLV